MAANIESSTLDGPPAPRVEQVGAYAWKALAGSAIGYAMDGFDLLILGFMLPAITAALHLTPGKGGALVTWTLIGAVAGGILFGALSDRYGRVRVLAWTILLFAVFTGLCAFAQGFEDLLVYRTIAGIEPAASSGSAWRSRRKRGRPASAPACRATSRSAGRPACCWPPC